MFNASTNPYTLAIPQSLLTSGSAASGNFPAINPTTLTIGSGDANAGLSLAFHPACQELSALYNTNKQLALLFNAGSLSYPMTKAQYNNGSVPKPPQLYSHSDQQAQWQTAIPDVPPTTGWAGRCADLLNASNAATNGQISMCSTIAGANIFEVGNQTTEYSVSTSGAITLNVPNAGGLNRQTALQNILGIGQSSSHLQTQGYSAVLAGALASSTVLGNAIGASATNYTPAGQSMTVAAALGTTGTNGFYFKNPITNPVPNASVTKPTSITSSLMPQLQMVARMIEAGNRPYTTNSSTSGLGMRRQIFFVQVGGYDTHTNQITSGSPQAGAQSNLLAELSQSISQFQQAMTFLGLNNSVTTFTSAGLSNSTARGAITAGAATT